MTTPKVLMVTESPKSLFIGTSRAYTIDFSDQGTPDDAGTSTLYDSDGVDKTSTLLSGSPGIVGDIVTTKKFTPATAGTYRLTQVVTISGQLTMGVVDISVHAAIPPDAAAKTPAVGSYSSLASIAALVPRYSNRSGTFDDTTRPNVIQMVELIEQVSALIDTMLSQEGFTIPITNTTVKNSLDLFVGQECAAIVEGINGSGRFGPTTKKGGSQGRFALVFDDVKNYIENNAFGFEQAGAARTYDFAEGIGFRDTDESGDSIFPIRQRKEYGSEWINWDS